MPCRSYLASASAAAVLAALLASAPAAAQWVGYPTAHVPRKADGKVDMQPVYCLGNCALGPAMMFDDRLYGRVTPERFEEILAEHGAAGGRK